MAPQSRFQTLSRGAGGGLGGGSGVVLSQTFRRWDLVPLSVSSVGPLFSVAATGGVMVGAAGWWTLPAVGFLAVPFVVSSFVFRLLNRHFPHAGASYHWSARVIGAGPARFQAWILILAYFTSIPPIAIPAATYTLALISPHSRPSPVAETVAALFWIGFAAVPLLAGARPTARLTQLFLAVELAALAAFAVAGVARLGSLSVPVHFGPPPVGGMLVVAVVAATILDGWEIDSFAAEESRSPRVDPGFGGIVGAFLALGFYAVVYPLMLAETPMRRLANAADPMAVWGARLFPGHSWVMLVPVLASTAGGLWLTTYILSRALFAMGRERLVPPGLAKLSRRQVPHVAIVAVLVLTALVVLLQLSFSSLGDFFKLVLSAAGFFLLAEFFLDSVTATVFLTVGHRKLPEVRIAPHAHRLLTLGAVFSAAVMGALLVGFFVYGPRVIGSGLDQTLSVLLVGGVIFAWVTGRRVMPAVGFHGRAVAAGVDEAVAAVEGRP